MAEGMLLGAALGAGGAALSGNDMLKGAALGGAMGGATAGFGGAGVSSGVSGATTAAANGSMVPLATQQVAGSAALNGANGAVTAAANGSMTPTGSMFGGFGDTIGQGFDYINDKTGMENRDWTKMGLSHGINAMTPEQQQQIQAAPMGQGISRPQVDLSQSRGSLLSSNPMTSGAGGQQLTPEQLKQLQQQGLL